MVEIGSGAQREVRRLAAEEKKLPKNTEKLVSLP